MGDIGLRSKYDRLRDEREGRRALDQGPQVPEWDAKDVDIVYETAPTSEANVAYDAVTGERVEVEGIDAPDNAGDGPSPLFTEYKNWSGGRLKSIDIVFGDDVRRLAYEIWLLKANRNVRRTCEMLEYELEGELPRFPNYNTVRRWSKEEEWEAKASEDIANVAPHLNRRHLEKLFAYTDEAIETKIAIMRNEHPERDAKRLDTISRSVDQFLVLRGLGTAGVQGGAEPPRPNAKVLEGEADGRSKSAALRDEILEGKQQVAGKKKHR